MTVLNLPLGTNQAIPDRGDRDWSTAAELVADATITYRQLDYWTRTGLLRPQKATPGSGHLRCYPNTEVDKAQAIKDLLDAGMGLPTIRQVIDDFLTDGVVTVRHITIARADQEAP